MPSITRYAISCSTYNAPYDAVLPQKAEGQSAYSRLAPEKCRDIAMADDVVMADLQQREEERGLSTLTQLRPIDRLRQRRSGVLASSELFDRSFRVALQPIDADQVEQLLTRMDIELLIHMAHMRFRGTVGDEQLVLDLPDGFALRQKHEHLGLTRRQPEPLR